MRTSDKQKEQIDTAVAKFFFASNIAFNAAATQQYKDMMEALRPGYKPPDRSALSGRLLDSVAEEVEDKFAMQLRASHSSVTLLQDGWSSVRNDPVIATSIYTGEKTFLLNAVDCQSITNIFKMNKTLLIFLLVVTPTYGDNIKGKYFPNLGLMIEPSTYAVHPSSYLYHI